MKTKFLVFTDLHVDIMHDAVARMEIILNAAREQNVDFLMHLGDIMYPEEAFVRQHAPDDWERRKDAWFVCDRDDEKIVIRQMLADSGLKLYSVLGNHDMDSCNKETACAYWNMPSPYYSFVEGGVRFIALDSQYIRTQEGIIDFAYCNYAGKNDIHFFPEPEMQWLEETVMASEQPCILLSHASIGDEILHVRNNERVWELIARANQDRRRVIAAFNGHNHVDGLTIRRSVPFVSVNSASNIWIGMQYAATRYSETISRLYPSLRGTAPYFDPLYAVVTVDDTGILIEGTQSSFVGPSPQALGFDPALSYHTPAPVIRSRRLPLEAIDGDGVTDRFLR